MLTPWRCAACSSVSSWRGSLLEGMRGPLGRACANDRTPERRQRMRKPGAEIRGYRASGMAALTIPRDNLGRVVSKSGHDTPLGVALLERHDRRAGEARQGLSDRAV